MVLRWKSQYDIRDYELYLIQRTGDPLVQRLVLPSTTEASHYPTDRAPDEMFLNEDGAVLTYIYPLRRPCTIWTETNSTM